MFCPNCGANQGESRKFCTVCGTNLLLVSQALTGQLPVAAPQQAPAVNAAVELERQKYVARGLRLALIGGGLVSYKLLSLLFSFGRGSSFGFWGFVGLVMLAFGISRIIGARPAPGPMVWQRRQMADGSQQAYHAPQPVFSGIEPSTPNTSELDPYGNPKPSVTEDETRHLPG